MSKSAGRTTQSCLSSFLQLTSYLVCLQYVCWAELAYIQLLTPRASFLGHLGGILAGLLHVHVIRGAGTALPQLWESRRHTGRPFTGEPRFATVNGGPQSPRSASEAHATGQGVAAGRPSQVRLIGLQSPLIYVQPFVVPRSLNSWADHTCVDPTWLIALYLCLLQTTCHKMFSLWE